MEAKLLERFKGSVSKSTTVKMLPTIKKTGSFTLNKHEAKKKKKLAIKEDVIGTT